MKENTCLLLWETTINRVALIQAQKQLCQDIEEALRIIDRVKERLMDGEILTAEIFKLDKVGEAFGYGQKAKSISGL